MNSAVADLSVRKPIQGAQEEREVAIRVRALHKRYRSLEAVRGIDFDVYKGEIFGLIGPDGAGKTHEFSDPGRRHGSHQRRG